MLDEGSRFVGRKSEGGGKGGKEGRRVADTFSLQIHLAELADSQTVNTTKE